VKKLRKNDTVQVISGDHAGERGQVLSVMTKEERVIVQGVNIAKVHRKRTRQNDGGIIERESPLRISNVAVVCTTCNGPRRVGIRTNEDGTRQRYCKKCNEPIE
jgi:large subunit ribosomal protein L24